MRFNSLGRRENGHSHQHGRSGSAAIVRKSATPTLPIGIVCLTALVGGAAYWYSGQRAVSTAASQLSIPPGGQEVHSTAGGVAAENTRRAIVVGQGGLYTGDIVGDGPLSKETDDAGRKILEMMSPEQATQKLRKNEESWLVGRGQGVVRYDVVQLPSNDPIEDDHAEKIIEIPGNVAAVEEGTSNSDWMFWGVFDGHSGWTTSAKLRQVLISFVARELNSTYKAALADPALRLPTPESIDRAIKKGFVLLDNEIVHESVKTVTKAQSKRVAAEVLAPAFSGSCALLSFYDSQSKLLRVACTGDSRAVLGRMGPSGKWTATPLSIDQTGATKEEAERLRREHPGEPDVVSVGRVLGGLEPTRAFGDAVYKWSLETQEKLRSLYFGRTPSPKLKTPPYVTAEPVVTTTKIEPKNGDFLVMATDGLWECLTNEEVVGLVGQWLDVQTKDGSSNGTPQTSGWLSSWLGSQKKEKLPVEKNADADGRSGQRAPIRQRQWNIDDKKDERFVVEDKNVATHLIRNALGGKDTDQVCALLTLPSPFSRRYRDDLTVEVIFFGEGDNSNTVVLNQEASAASADVKAKL
ncbi:protein serine/threonine phosphatase 2C [Rhizodiscina lignyota]|uniref:Protein serine/threonine phosphatase 2C n=1 Tax=Rhizodiscina lignyota TaxID=1504668 RepID=A0A9P4MB27_9PEZI|nr:protein serine/threonine phosphatase 2C [Rhizodiscina lignyota]